MSPRFRGQMAAARMVLASPPGNSPQTTKAEALYKYAADRVWWSNEDSDREQILRTAIHYGARVHPDRKKGTE